MPQLKIHRHLIDVGLSAGLCLLTACHSGSEPPAVSAAAVKAGPPAVKAPDPTAGMAHAVVMDKTGAPVDLMYEVKSAPSVGRPVDLDLTLITGARLQSLQTRLSATPNLTLAATQLAPVTDVKAGQMITQHLALTPTQVGIEYVTVAVSTQAPDGTLSRSFSIPLVIASTPPKIAAPKPAEAAGKRK